MGPLASDLELRLKDTLNVNHLLFMTKLYHSVEGGLVVTKDAGLLKKSAHMRNFGYDGLESFADLGINGKNSEYHAAMGLANLKYLDVIHQKRKELSARYDEKLKNLKARQPLWHSASEQNYSYYPLVFETEEFMLQCVELLKLNEVFNRRYFYPSLATSLPYVKPEFSRYGNKYGYGYYNTVSQKRFRN